MSVMTKFCTSCANAKLAHDFQDKKYGKYVRVFNLPGKAGVTSALALCTVCGKPSK